jgi:toxin ParE1/3/4
VRERAVEFAPEAVEDLRKLYDWIAEATGAQAAMGYVARLESFCRGLGLASERGRLREDIGPGLRIVGFERRVTILRLFYGGRNWEAVLR